MGPQPVSAARSSHPRFPQAGRSVKLDIALDRYREAQARYCEQDQTGEGSHGDWSASPLCQACATLAC